MAKVKFSRRLARGVRRRFLAASRSLATRARSAVGRCRPIILMYHRVADVSFDPFDIAVSPDNFRRQIAALQSARRVVPLSWMAAELKNGRVPWGTAAVTFDDGYVDVLANAKPILKHYGCPATLFLTTAATSRGEVFWWDRLASLFSPVDAQADGACRQTLASAWSELKQMSATERFVALRNLEQKRDVGLVYGDEGRCMTESEVREFWEPGFLDVEAHTVTHPTLSQLPYAEQLVEIEHGIAQVKSIVGAGVSGFAYPFGEYDQFSIEALKAVNVAYACATACRAVDRSSDILQLPRIHVPDVGAALFRQRVLAFG